MYFSSAYLRKVGEGDFIISALKNFSFIIALISTTRVDFFFF